MVYDGYTEAVREYWRRSSMRQEVVDYLTIHAQELGIAEAHSMLTVGPGDGGFELDLIKSTLPAVNHIVAVEPDVENGAKFKQNAENQIPDIQFTLSREYGENFPGPTSGVDIIVLMEVIAYIKYVNGPSAFLKKCHEWLNPGGIIIITGMDSDHVLNQVYKSLIKDKINPDEVGGIAAVEAWGEDYVLQVEEAGLSYKHIKLPSTIDLREPDISFASFLLRKRPTPEEMAICEDYLKSFRISHCQDGKQTFNEHLILISK